MKTSFSMRFPYKRSVIVNIRHGQFNYWGWLAFLDFLYIITYLCDFLDQQYMKLPRNSQLKAYVQFLFIQGCEAVFATAHSV